MSAPSTWTHTVKHITERTGPFGIPYEKDKIVQLDDSVRLNPPFVPPAGLSHVLGSVSGVPNQGPRYGGIHNRLDGYNIDAAARAAKAPTPKRFKSWRQPF